MQAAFAARLESSPEGDSELEGFIESVAPVPDAQLGELIEIDGRWRLAQGKAVTLDRYLALIGEPDASPVAVDAAIDMTLRSMSQKRGRPSTDAIEELVSAHPDLRAQILTAGELGLSLWSTMGHASSGPASPIPVPSTFGPALADGRARYQLLRVAGSGAWAHTYVAVDRHFDDPDEPALVAIKVLSRSDGSQAERERFTDEANKARRVVHPNVVRVLEHGVDASERPFIVFEFAPGGDLNDLLRRRGGTLAPREAAGLVARIANGVQAIHSASLVHRDLKPSNVVLDEDGTPKIVDLGIAQRTTDGARTTGLDLSTGTPAFMAPEQFRGEETAADPAVDVYALGHLLYWLVTGDLANGDTPERIAEKLAAPRSGGVEIPLGIKGVDRDLVDICAKAMASSPGDRYLAPGELAQDLERWTRREVIPWTRPGVFRRTSLATRRRPVVAGMFAVLVLVIGSAGTIGAVMKSRADSAAIRFEVEQAKFDATEAIRLDIGESLQDIGRYLDSREWDGAFSQNMWIYWGWEWFYGPQQFSTPDAQVTIFAHKERIIGDRVCQLQSHGRGESLERHTLDMLRGFWALESGQIRKSIELLDSSRDFFERTLDPSDGFLVIIDSVQACARADLVSLEPEGRLEEAREIADELESLLTQFDGLIDERTLAGMVNSRLRVLYSDWVLGDKARLAAIDRTRELGPRP